MKYIPLILITLITIPIGVFLGLKYETLFLLGYIYSPFEDFIKSCIEIDKFKKDTRKRFNVRG